jgi:hypothetical protein
MFQITFQHRHYYYLTQELMQAMYPSPINGASWKERRELKRASNALTILLTRARPANVNSTAVFETSVRVDGDANQDEEEFQRKCQKIKQLPVHAHNGLLVRRLVSYSAAEDHRLEAEVLIAAERLLAKN